LDKRWRERAKCLRGLIAHAQHDYGEWPLRKVLLVRQVAIERHQHLEPTFYGGEQLTIWKLI
jgi:hypothetical protein